MKTFSNSSLFDLQDIEDDTIAEISTPSPIKDISLDIQFREYEREGSLFKAKDVYYRLGEDRVFEKIGKNNHKMIFCPKVGAYYEMKRNGEYDEKEYLDLYVIQHIVLDENTDKISKQELMIRMSMDQIEFEDRFVQDLYLDTYHFIYQPKEEDSLFTKDHLRMKKKYIFAVVSHHLPSSQQISL